MDIERRITMIDIDEIKDRLEEEYCLDKRVSIIRDMKSLLSELERVNEDLSKERDRVKELAYGNEAEIKRSLGYRERIKELEADNYRMYNDLLEKTDGY
jgi:hypothetical protein